MTTSTDCTLAAALAQTLRANCRDLVRRWLERIVDRVTLDPNRVFPTDELLDHVPLLIEGIADYLEDPVEEITTDVPVVAKAMELGELRHAQGFDAHEIMKEYELLGGILFHCLIRAVGQIEEPCSRSELLACAHRLFRAIAVIQQVTTDHFLRLADERVREREERLRGFNRMVSHEMKNRIGAVRGANAMLQEEWIAEDPKQRSRFTSIIARNTDGMQTVLQNLIELSRMDTQQPQGRNVLLSDAVTEVARQLRDFAHARGVEIRLAEELLCRGSPRRGGGACLSNYVSNAIKYQHPAKLEHWVRVEEKWRPVGTLGTVRDDRPGTRQRARCTVEVRDRLFQRFFRAHTETVTREEGTGLGLSIVRDTAESVGGRAWAEFDVEEGTVFAVAFPLMRGIGSPTGRRWVVRGPARFLISREASTLKWTVGHPGIQRRHVCRTMLKSVARCLMLVLVSTLPVAGCRTARTAADEIGDAAGAAGRAIASINPTNQGAEALVQGSVSNVDRRARTVLSSMGLQLTKAEYEDNATEREYEARSGKRVVHMKLEARGTTSTRSTFPHARGRSTTTRVTHGRSSSESRGNARQDQGYHYGAWTLPPAPRGVHSGVHASTGVTCSSPAVLVRGSPHEGRQSRPGGLRPQRRPPPHPPDPRRHARERSWRSSR